jgi:hypothetical protein
VKPDDFFADGLGVDPELNQKAGELNDVPALGRVTHSRATSIRCVELEVSDKVVRGEQGGFVGDEQGLGRVIQDQTQHD